MATKTRDDLLHITKAEKRKRDADLFMDQVNPARDHVRRPRPGSDFPRELMKLTICKAGGIPDYPLWLSFKLFYLLKYCPRCKKIQVESRFQFVRWTWRRRGNQYCEDCALQWDSIAPEALKSHKVGSDPLIMVTRDGKNILAGITHHLHEQILGRFRLCRICRGFELLEDLHMLLHRKTDTRITACSTCRLKVLKKRDENGTKLYKDFDKGECDYVWDPTTVFKHYYLMCVNGLEYVGQEWYKYIPGFTKEDRKKGKHSKKNDQPAT